MRPAHALLRALVVVTLSTVAMLGPETADAEGTYTFPVDFDPLILSWDPHHWDGSLAVDIGINPDFSVAAPERMAFYAANVVAVTDGTAFRLDNPRGGTAVVLHGEDGRTYYYAHLSEAAIEPSAFRSVRRGEVLGTIGRTGTWTQYLEPHLHLSIASGHRHGTDWEADIDPVWWLERTFGRPPRTSQRLAYPASDPRGAPLFGDYLTVQSFEDARSASLLLAGVTLQSLQPGPAPVRAPLTGAVRVHRDTVLGVRLQITNARSGWSIILSGDIQPRARTGDIAYRETIVGVITGRLHYMAFQYGAPVSPPVSEGTASGRAGP